MSYLTKDQRQYEIQQAAINIAIKDGLAAITARKIAAEAKIATGQLHHHFESVSQLKASTLLTITKQFIEAAEQTNKKKSIFNQVINLISPLRGETGIVFRRLWSEAVFLAEKNDDIKNAYQSTMQDWHKAIVKLLKKARKSDNFFVKKPSAIAWRLIALSCGLDSIMLIKDSKMTDKLIREYIKIALSHEIRASN